jgi:cyclic pyranopterin monophosphate synthase
VAGILAAKRVPELIPLCHQIPLNSIQINFEIDQQNDQILVFCWAKAVEARTGVEMEAMVGNGVKIINGNI